MFVRYVDIAFHLTLLMPKLWNNWTLINFWNIARTFHLGFSKIISLTLIFRISTRKKCDWLQEKIFLLNAIGGLSVNSIRITNYFRYGWSIEFVITRWFTYIGFLNSTVTGSHPGYTICAWRNHSVSGSFVVKNFKSSFEELKNKEVVLLMTSKTILPVQSFCIPFSDLR